MSRVFTLTAIWFLFMPWLAACGGSDQTGGDLDAAADSSDAGSTDAISADAMPSEPDASVNFPTITRTFCSRFEFDLADETGLATRLFAVRAVDEAGAPIAGTDLPPFASDGQGCADVALLDGQFNQVTVTNTSSNAPPMTAYFNARGPIEVGSFTIDVPIDVLSQEIGRLFRAMAYDVYNTPDADIRALYQAYRSGGDMLNAWEDGYAAQAGQNAFIDAAIVDPAPLEALATPAVCHAIAPASREFEDAGVIGGPTVIGDDRFTVSSTCFLDTFASVTGSGVSLSATVMGETVVTADLCRGTNYDDDRVEGFLGTKEIADASLNTQTGGWSFVRLAKGLDAAEPDHAFLDGGIFGIVGEAQDASDDDVELRAGDNVTLNVSGLLTAPVVLDISNRPDDINAAVGLEVDTDTQWIIVAQGISDPNTVDTDADGRADGDAVAAAKELMTTPVFVWGTCHPSEDVVVGHAGGVFHMTLADDLLITAEDEPEGRLFVYAYGMWLDSADTARYAALAEYVATAASQRGEAAARALDRRLVGGDLLALSPYQLAKVGAESGALCDLEVTGVGGGDDQTLYRIPYSATNCHAAGLRPDTAQVASCAPLFAAQLAADEHGALPFFCTPGVNGEAPAGTIGDQTFGP